MEAIPNTPKGAGGVTGAALIETMATAGHPRPAPSDFSDAMFLLRDENYAAWARGGEPGFEGWHSIKLVGSGLELIEGWPRRTLPALDDQDVQALLAAIGALAEREDLTPEQREAAGEFETAGKQIGYNALGAVLAGWVQGMGLG